MEKSPQEPAEPTWREAFAREMATLGATAQTVEYCLADIDDRCRTEGCDEAEAYGDPAAYARAVTGRQSPVQAGADPAEVAPRMSKHGIPAATVLGLIGVIGILSVMAVVYLFIGAK